MGNERSDRFVLMNRIVELSVADTWEAAKLEWNLIHVWFVDDGDELETCLCGHYPIKEVCVITNVTNGNTTEVGNVCVNRFLELASKIIFDGIKRIAKDKDKALNGAAIDYAFKQNWLNQWEHSFCHDTKKKRNLTVKQLSKRREINQRVLTNMKTRPAMNGGKP